MPNSLLIIDYDFIKIALFIPIELTHYYTPCIIKLNYHPKGANSMKPIDRGVSSDSYVFFHTASTVAQKAFLYVLCSGHYKCNPDYIVSRTNYNSFLLMYVKSGKGSLRVNQKKINFRQGQAVILDCYHPHTYQAEGNLEIIWVHFDGLIARNYYNHIVDTAGNVMNLKDLLSFEKTISKIYNIFQKGLPINEAVFSKYITDLLTDLIISNNEQYQSTSRSDLIDDVLSYIRDNLYEPLRLNDLADRISLSPYYFTRVFKKETGFTPHEYIIKARVNAAKFYLKTSTYPIKEICFNCGFTSESSFCTTFKKLEGMTPSDFRNQL